MKREENILAITEKLKEMSTETILFHEAVADVLGLHTTDHKCLDLIHRFGAMPTGAVTGIIDRLEKGGYVRRTNDPNDRRRTIVEPIKNKKLYKKIESIFMPLHQRIHMLLSSYSDHELSFLFNVITELVKQTHDESKKLRNL